MRLFHRVVAATLPSITVLLLAVPVRASDGTPTPSARGTPTPTPPVPCTAAALITAISSADKVGGRTLTLTPGCRYTLNAAQAGTEDSLPPIKSAITINGSGATVARSSASSTPNFRIFEVGGSGALTLRSLTISNGHAPGPEPDGGGGIEVSEGGKLSASAITVTDNVGTLGAGINNFGTANIQSSSISRNHGLHGGGVSNNSHSGRRTLTSSRISDNRAESDAGVGGGLHNQTGGSASVVNTAITGNRGDNSAGGIFNGHDSVMSLTDTHVSQNTAGPLFSARTVVLGGGVGNEGTLSLRTTSVDHNHAAKRATTLARGGGIANTLSDVERAAPPKLALTSSRVVDNVADDNVGGVYNSHGTVGLTSTRITNNRPTNCAGSPTPVPGCSD